MTVLKVPEKQLEKIIDCFCKRVNKNGVEQYDLSGEDQCAFIDFLNRHSSAHPNYFDVYRFMADELFVFSILAQMIPVMTDLKPSPIIIDTPDALKQLRARGFSDVLSWPDCRLGLIYNRVTAAHQRLNLPTYCGIFDEIGADSFIRDIWGFQIGYRTHIGKAAGTLPNDKRLNKNKVNYFGFSAYGALLEGKSK